jgi:hypothetical protein
MSSQPHQAFPPEVARVDRPAPIKLFRNVDFVNKVATSGVKKDPDGNPYVVSSDAVTMGVPARQKVV